MLNNAWPSNIWHLYDYFWDPSPSYFAVKNVNRKIHFSYNYQNNGIYISNNDYSDLICNFEYNIIIINGNDCKTILLNKIDILNTTIKADSNILIYTIDFSKYDNDVFIIYLESKQNKDSIITNTYFISKRMDEMDYSKSTYYNLPVTYYANLTSLEKFLSKEFQIDLDINIKTETKLENDIKKNKVIVEIKNNNNIMALFIECRLYEKESKNLINPVIWSDNFVSIKSKNDVIYRIEGEFSNDFGDSFLEISGFNINTKNYDLIF